VAPVAVLKEEVLAMLEQGSAHIVVQLRDELTAAVALPLPEIQRIVDDGVPLFERARDDDVDLLIERHVQDARGEVVLEAFVAARNLLDIEQVPIPDGVGLEAVLRTADADLHRGQARVGPHPQPVAQSLDARIEREILLRQQVRLAEGQQRAQPQLDVGRRASEAVAAEHGALPSHHQDLAHRRDPADLIGEDRVGLELEVLEALVAVRGDDVRIARHRQRKGLAAAVQALLEAREEDVPLVVPLGPPNQQPVVAPRRAHDHGVGRKAAQAVEFEPLPREALLELEDLFAVHMDDAVRHRGDRRSRPARSMAEDGPWAQLTQGQRGGGGKPGGGKRGVGAGVYAPKRAPPSAMPPRSKPPQTDLAIGPARASDDKGERGCSPSAPESMPLSVFLRSLVKAHGGARRASLHFGLTPPRHCSSSASLHLEAQARTLGLRPPSRPSPVSFVRP
jgi:hypothetical protein